MTAVDIAILIILFVSAVLGLVRGFLREVASLLIWILGFWLAVRFAPPIGQAMTFIKSSEDRLIVGYGVVLLVTLIVSTIVGMLLKRLVESSGAGVGDRSLGTIFGAARGAVMVTILIMIGEMALVPQPPWWRDSKFIPYAEPLVKVARRLSPVHVDFHPLQQAQAPEDLDKQTL
jgi:membrane protein required for colicin V production